MLCHLHAAKLCCNCRNNPQKDILKKTEDLIEEGADIIDIGAESTRPGAAAINQDQEIARIKDSLCKIVKIAHNAKVATAIDSYKYEVIKFALDNGVDIVQITALAIATLCF